MKVIRNEYIAIVNLLIRSLDASDLALIGLRKNWCKNQYHDDGKRKPASNNEKSEKPKGASGDHNNDNDDKIKSFVTKVIMWIITIYTVGSFISLLTSSRGDRPEVSSPAIGSVYNIEQNMRIWDYEIVNCKWVKTHFREPAAMCPGTSSSIICWLLGK